MTMHDHATMDMIEGLKGKGYKITRARTAIAGILMKNDSPISALELHAVLAKRNIAVNNVTVYRELALLEKEGFLHGVKLNDGVKRYCLASAGHHHHLVCTNCKGVQDFEMEHDLDSIEKKINKEASFTVQSHALEFYGLCGQCS